MESNIISRQVKHLESFSSFQPFLSQTHKVSIEIYRTNAIVDQESYIDINSRHTTDINIYGRKVAIKCLSPQHSALFYLPMKGKNESLTDEHINAITLGLAQYGVTGVLWAGLKGHEYTQSDKHVNKLTREHGHMQKSFHAPIWSCTHG